MPRQDVVAAIDTWPLEGPQTWEERKREQIARNRPFADLRPITPHTAGAMQPDAMTR
jgi:hypothetical protein